MTKIYYSVECLYYNYDINDYNGYTRINQFNNYESAKKEAKEKVKELNEQYQGICVCSSEYETAYKGTPNQVSWEKQNTWKVLKYFKK